MSKPGWRNVQTISRMLKSATVVGLLVNQIAAELDEITLEKLEELHRLGSATISIKNDHSIINLSELSPLQYDAVGDGLEALAKTLGFEVKLDCNELGNPFELEYCLTITEPIDDVIDGGGDDGDERVELAIPKAKAMTAHA